MKHQSRDTGQLPVPSHSHLLRAGWQQCEGTDFFSECLKSCSRVISTPQHREHFGSSESSQAPLSCELLNTSWAFEHFLAMSWARPHLAQ